MDITRLRAMEVCFVSRARKRGVSMHKAETISMIEKNKEELLVKQNGKIVALTWLRYENKDCIIDKLKCKENVEVVRDLLDFVGKRAKQRGCSTIRTHCNSYPGLFQSMGYNRRISIIFHGCQKDVVKSSFILNRPDTIKNIEYLKKV